MSLTILSLVARNIHFLFFPPKEPKTLYFPLEDGQTCGDVLGGDFSAVAGRAVTDICQVLDKQKYFPKIISEN